MSVLGFHTLVPEGSGLIASGVIDSTGVTASLHAFPVTVLIRMYLIDMSEEKIE